MKRALDSLAHIDLSLNNYLERSQRPVLSNIFYDTRNTYMHNFQLFNARYGSVPNHFRDTNIEAQKAFDWVIDKYSSTITDYHHASYRDPSTNEIVYKDIYCFLQDDLLLVFDTNNNYIDYLYRVTEFSKVDEIIKGIYQFVKVKREILPEISIVVNDEMEGLQKRTLPIVKNELNLNDNYNDDFLPIHETIINRLTKENDKGVVLLHGKPGTGKTNYLRYLIGLLNKNVIYITPQMASTLLDPGLLDFVIRNKNSIFIIEDAETLIKDRERTNYSPVSALLNISDGLLSDSLNTQIICTFHTDLSQIDPALMRKGRLIARYEFKELDSHKATNLSKKLGLDIVYNKPTSVADIYNQDESDFQIKKPKASIGFAAK